MFAHLQTAPTPDLSAESTTALIQLMLGQAQETFCIKASRGEVPRVVALGGEVPHVVALGVVRSLSCSGLRGCEVPRVVALGVVRSLV